MSDKYNDSDYLYLTAVLRARQANMLSSEIFEQMLATGDFRDAANILTESGWTDMSDMDSSEIDSCLNEYKNSIFEDLSKYVPHKEVLDLFRVKYDYHNAKCIVKGEGIGSSPDDIISGIGRVSSEKLKKAYVEDDYRFIPLDLANAVIESKKILARTNNPQLADFILDKALYTEMLSIAKELGNQFLINYVKLNIDGANLRTIVRCIRMNKDASFVENALIEGGTISNERILQSFSSGDGALNLYSVTNYKDAAILGAEAVKGGRLTEFELECDNTVNRYIKDAKLRGFGPEAVAGYLSAVENNITSVRMILTGLLAGISPNTLRERLRLSYV